MRRKHFDWMNDECICWTLANNIAQDTNQQGAIPISLLNSHFHSSIGTSHSKACITLPPLPGTAQHANQVNTFSPHFLSHTESQYQLHVQTAKTSRDEGLTFFTFFVENMSKCTQRNTHKCLSVSFLTSVSHSEGSTCKVLLWPMVKAITTFINVMEIIILCSTNKWDQYLKRWETTSALRKNSSLFLTFQAKHGERIYYMICLTACFGMKMIPNHDTMMYETQVHVEWLYD